MEPWVTVHRHAPDTERAAANAAAEKYPQRALDVLRYLVSVGGDYDHHGCETMGMIKDSYAPARNALMRNGLVEDSKVRALNVRNRPCIVWVPTEAGRKAAETGDLDTFARPQRRHTKTELTLDAMTEWANVLADELGKADPDNDILAIWRSR